ncbi:MAG: GNAT family N-acetyltransferase [Roseibium sp.]|nr:GNAT family N-acetyltransferase [Roseibium sp.]
MEVTDIHIAPLTPGRWPDLVDLFGPDRGANSGCWCLWPLLRAKDWQVLSREQRKAGLRQRVEAGPAPGLLAYADGQPVGWVAVGPRAGYVRFQLSRTSKPLDKDLEDGPQTPFAITCFYIRAGWRKSGLMGVLGEAAVTHARQAGADAVDACPIDPEKPLQWGEGFVGMASVFRTLGFEEIARRSPRRPLMRLWLDQTQKEA